MTAAAPAERPRCGVYLRISSDPGNDELGVQRQEKWARKFCADYGWEPIIYRDNDRSATNGKVREQYEALLQAITEGELRAVAVWGQDRLCREPVDFEVFRRLAKANGVLFATRTGIKNLSKASDTFSARNEVNAAAYEIENMRERMIESFQDIAGEGRAWWPTRPFGYTMPKMIRKRVATTPELVKDEADAIRQAYKDVIARRSLKAIAREWNTAGLRTPPTGGCGCDPAPEKLPCPVCKRHRRAKPEGNEWTSMSLRQLLINPRNAALRVYWPKTKGEKGRKFTDIVNHVVGKGDWPAIVSEQTWRGAVAVLTEPSRLTPGAGFSTGRKYMLSGLARCSECGGTVTSGIPSNTKSRAAVYQCKAPGCGKVRRSVADVDRWVRGHIIAALARDIDVLTTRQDIDTSELLARLTEIEGEKNAAAAMVGTKAITLSQLAIINADLDKEVAAITAKMRDAEKTAALDEFIGVSDVATVFDGLDLDRQRAVIRLLCTVTIHPGQHSRRPFDEELVKVEPAY